MLCFILTYSYIKLIFMYIIGCYFFQKGHFQGSPFLGEGELTTPLPPCSGGPAIGQFFGKLMLILNKKQ